MFSFLISLCVLILGYLLYGRFVEKIFGPDPNRITPAVSKEDGVDYVVMPNWKVFMIQFLNIAGTGPIFGAIMGAKFGPASYLWIVLGCIFIGAVHDYMSGMLSMRHDGLSLPEIVGKYWGQGAKKLMLIFSLLLLVLLGAVFTYSPALIIEDLCGGNGETIMIWVGLIFAYYLIATVLPIDKIIGKLYPLFGFALLFMAVALFVCLLIKWPHLPEIWDGLQNRGPEVGVLGQSLFPCLFITIACGAISGFHGTQSPMMARCMKNEKLGRPIFYGAMITEGIVALIWAAISSYFFFAGGAAEVGSSLQAAAPTVVNKVSSNWLGIIGGILAILGVVAAPITSGDTAFRSARLVISDHFKLSQSGSRDRLFIAIPLFFAAGLLLWFNIQDEDGFNIIWRYFGWSNQMLASITLWVISIFLMTKRKKPYYLIAEIPAIFMTIVCITYIATQKIGFNAPMWLGITLGTITAVICTVLMHLKAEKTLRAKLLKRNRLKFFE